MKNGDLVIVMFDGGFKPEHGVLIEHTNDWRSVTIQTDRGEIMSGVINSPEDIIEASLLK